MKPKTDLDPIVREFLRQNAKKGGDALKRKQPKSYYADIAKQRWAKQKADK